MHELPEEGVNVMVTDWNDCPVESTSGELSSKPESARWRNWSGLEENSVDTGEDVIVSILKQEIYAENRFMLMWQWQKSSGYRDIEIW